MVRKRIIFPAKNKSIRCWNPECGKDVSLFMQAIDFLWIIIGTVIGFFGLAALLLVPVWRFLTREERASEKWDAHVKDTGRNKPAS